MIKYAFTLKCNWRDFNDDRDLLIKMIKSIYVDYKVVTYYFEDEDKKGAKTRLHVHGVIEAPPKLQYRQFCRKGWHLHHKRMYSDDWINYIKKQEKRREKENINFIKNNYAFIDEESSDDN